LPSLPSQSPPFSPPQELIPGRTEYSASLLVEAGMVREAVVVAYVYEAASGAYVWPRVKIRL
jgi:hypothetical protein